MTEPTHAVERKTSYLIFRLRTPEKRRRAFICVGATLVAVAIIAFLPRQRFAAATFLLAGVAYFSILASQARGRWRDILLLVAALFVVPAIGEVIFAAITTPPPPFAHYSTNIESQPPMLGYALAPSKTAHVVKVTADGRPVFDTTYTIDEHGLRRTESNPDGPTVAFFFDSMTFGEGVEDSQTLPQQFSDLTGRRYRVLNFGVPGYGPQAMLRTLETGYHDDLLGRPALFVIQTAAWHAERAACRPTFVWRTPRYALVDGKAVFQGRCAEGFTLWASLKLHQSYLYERVIRPQLIDQQHDLDLYLAEMRGILQLITQKYGSRAIILCYPSKSDQFAGTTYTNDKIIEAFRDSGATVIDLSQTDKGIDGMAIPGDGHPTAKAHRLHAALLRDAIADTAAIKSDRQ